MIRDAKCRARGGFTLVEILVVLAILTLLSALLLAAFGRVREKSRQATCLSNLKQIGLAMQLYADDNSRYMPPAVTNNAAKVTMLWPELIFPYTKTKAVFVCPTDALQFEFPAGWVNSYGYNSYIAGVMGVMAGGANGIGPKTQGAISRPTATVLVTDSGTTAKPGLPPTQWPVVEGSAAQISDSFTHDGKGNSFMPAPHARHAGKTNVLWADGHATTQSVESFYNAPDHLRPGDKFTGISPCFRPSMGCP